MTLIPRRLFAAAILVLLFSGLQTALSPVAFAKGNEDSPGQIKKAARASESTDTQEEALEVEEADETEEADDADVQLLRIADRAGSDASSDKSSSDGAADKADEADSRARTRSTSDDDVEDGCNPQKPNQCHLFVPDPEPVKTAKASKGPLDCSDDYDDGIDDNPYDHDNCDGTIGLHGNGGNGKCAGCTGKADDKWPGGQYPGDHNNGYECDHNGGIGKGNPAHSKCPVEADRRSRRPSRPSPPISRPSQPPRVVEIPAPDVVKGRPPVTPAVIPGVPAAGQPAQLPVTGPQDASIFMFIGLLFIGAGSLFVSADKLVTRIKSRY